MRVCLHRATQAAPYQFGRSCSPSGGYFGRRYTLPWSACRVAVSGQVARSVSVSHADYQRASVTLVAEQHSRWALSYARGRGHGRTQSYSEPKI